MRILVSTLAIPLLFIGAGLSIPATVIHRYWQRRSEKRFLEQMRAAGRSKLWAEAIAEVRAGRGTLVEEYLSVKGPYRLWWTSEDIPLVAPFPCCFEELPWWQDSEIRAFFFWCRSRFTHPATGSALLVETKGGNTIDFGPLRLERRCVCVGHWPAAQKE